jgi:putative transposase
VNDPSRSRRTNTTLRTELGDVPIEVPRDRDGSFEPQLARKRQTRFAGFDAKILALYARGMTVRDIQGHLEDLYGVEVSPDLISRVTSAVMEDVVAWQNRPLDAVYPIVYLDALVVEVRDQGVVRNKSVYLAPRRHDAWQQGGARALDRAERGRQVLAQGRQ